MHTQLLPFYLRVDYQSRTSTAPVRLRAAEVRSQRGDFADTHAPNPNTYTRTPAHTLNCYLSICAWIIKAEPALLLCVCMPLMFVHSTVMLLPTIGLLLSALHVKDLIFAHVVILL